MRNCFISTPLARYIFAFCTILLCATSCIKDDVVAPEPVSQVTMRLVASDAATRSEGEAAFNENRINRALLFFYPLGADNDTKAVYCVKEGSIEKPLGKEKIHEVSPVRLSIDQREQIFGSDGDQKGHVFAVINLPEDVTIADDATINEIRQTVVEADFRSTLAVEINDYSTTPVTTSTEQGIQPDFVMLGEAWLQFDDEESKQVYGEIPLTRTAAKIRLALRVPNEIEVDADESDEETAQKEKWEPQTTGMRVYITNGVRKGYIGGGQFPRAELEANNGSGYYRISASGATTPGSGEGSSGESSGSSNNDYMTIARKVFDHTNMPNFPAEMRGTPLADTGENPGDFIYWHDVPLYSYPHQWANTPFEDRQTYLIVQVPWRKKSETAGEMNFQTFFYQVPINLRGGTVTEDPNDGVVGDDEQIKDRGKGDPGGFANGGSWSVAANTIESNMYYLVKLDVGMLGSFNAEDPLELQAQYYVVPWQTEVINAKLRDNRYLVVNQTNWTMNNETDLDIPYYTSHETVVARVKFYYYNFNPKGNGGVTYYDDGEEITIDYRGKPLRRTFFWYNPELSNRYFTENNTGYSSVAEANSLYNLSMEQNGGDPIWSTAIDNDNLTVSYHHDMMRWTEYVGAKERFVPNQYDINGFTGEDNGRAFEEANKKNATTWLKKSDESNWSIITAEITIIHKDLLKQGLLDNTRFQQIIYITQYPAQYIETDHNEGYANDNIGNENVFVNGYQGSNDGMAKEWHHTYNSTQSMNYNPNMYVITITQLGPDDGDFIIGDPRSLSVNNNLSNGSLGGTNVDTSDDLGTNQDNPAVLWRHTTGRHYVKNDYRYWNWRSTTDGTPTYSTYSWDVEAPVQAPGMTGGDRYLQSYYPTDETSGPGSKEQFVAPKIRVASSFGSVSSLLHRAGARRRCAAYQEAGRPAGRWRLPTKAEIQYIANLSAKGRIPELFSRNPSLIRMNANDDSPRTFQIYGLYGPTRNDASEGYYLSAQGLAYIDGWDGVDFPERPRSPTFGQVFILPEPSTSQYIQLAVRCVYDEWYWLKEDGSQDILEKNRWTTFTWGDKPKSNPQD